MAPGLRGTDHDEIRFVWDCRWKGKLEGTDAGTAARRFHHQCMRVWEENSRLEA